MNTSPLPKHHKWTTLTPLQTKFVKFNPICFGKSIWIATIYSQGERGLVEFECESNSMKQPTPYSTAKDYSFEPEYHSVCSSDDNIVLVHGNGGRIVTFNPISKQYGAAVSMPVLGFYTTSLVIDGNVHIFHGNKNEDRQYLVYSPLPSNSGTFFWYKMRYLR